MKVLTGQPLRVYALTPAFPPEIGGQEDHIQQLSAALIANGVEVLVLTRRFDAAHPRREVLDTVPVLRLRPTGETKGAGWRAVPKLLLLLVKMTYHLLTEARRYDVILVSGFNILPLAAVFVCTLIGKRCVVRPESPMELRHGVGVESQASMGVSGDSLLIRAFMWSRRQVTRRVDRYVAISAEIRAGLIQLGVDPAKIVSIPNGIDVRKFAPVTPERRRALRERLGLPRDARILIYTGRLAVTKGVMLLAEVWRDIAGEFPDTHLLVVGTGFGSIDSCEAELRQFVATHGLADRTTLPGNVPNVNEYLQAADAFVFPSDYEGFGLSLVEAMAAGLPMVSTRVGVAADLAEHFPPGLLVEPRRPVEFKNALQNLLSDPGWSTGQMEDLRVLTPSQIQARYSMDAVAQRHIGVFAEALGTTSGTTMNPP